MMDLRKPGNGEVDRLDYVMSTSVTIAEVHEAVEASKRQSVGGRVGGDTAAHLMADHGESTRTSGTRSTEWKVF